MSLKKFQRNKVWYLRGVICGHNIYETTGTADKKAAEAFRINREKELLQQSVFGRRAVATFEEAALSYLENGGSGKFLGSFDPITKKWNGVIGHFYGCKLHNLKQADLDKAANTLMPNTKGQSRNRNIYTPFIAVWNHAVAHDMCEVRQWVRPKTQDVAKRRYATFNEVDALEAVAPKHIKPLIIFMAYTGARLIEALELQWHDVDLAQSWAVFQLTKRKGETRGVPLHPRVIAALESIVIPKGKSREGAVFRTHKRLPYTDKKRMGGGQIKSAWATTCKKAGITGLTPHCLRHTFATWLKAVGVDEHDKDLLMGHASNEMSRLYAHVPQLTLIETVQRLPNGAADMQSLSEGWRKSLRNYG